MFFNYSDGSYTVIDYCERNNLKAEDADSSSQIPAKYVQGKHLLRIILHTNKEKPVKMVYIISVNSENMPHLIMLIIIKIIVLLFNQYSSDYDFLF